MLSQTYLASYAYENDLVHALKRQLGKDGHSAYIFAKIVEGINQDLAAQKFTRDLVIRLRLAIKLNPYSTDVPQLTAIHHQVLKHVLTAKIAPALATITQCEKADLPVPVITSCSRYLDKARKLQTSIQERYFGITPLIVRGDTSVTGEVFNDGVLTFPVNDSYEALPVKVFETAVLLRALSDKVGFMKIDDDLTVLPSVTVDYQKAHDTLKAADYLGVAANSSFQDRAWHAGKCAQNVPAVYGKPFRVNWPRGAFYCMSPLALHKLTSYYMRFPGTLDGEVFEDKAVAEILYDNQITVVPFALEHLFGFATDSPERLLKP